VTMPLPRTSTGVPGLDRLIDGGFPSRRAILLRGQPGTGKTTFGVQFLMDGIACEERGALVTVDEKPEHVIADADRVGWDVAGAIDAKNLSVLDASPFFTATRRRGWGPSGVDARQVSTDLIQQIRAIGAKRLVIDSLTSLVPMDMAPGDAQNHLRSIIQSLEGNFGCTTILTWRTHAADDPLWSGHMAEYLASGVMELRLSPSGRSLARSIVLRKMRATPFEPGEYPVTLDRWTGLSVGQPSATGTVRELAAI
jgi:circadian clock protein KaiC